MPVSTPAPLKTTTADAATTATATPPPYNTLFNKMLGQLHHCLQTRQTFDPIKAFGQPRTAPREPAAA